MGSFRDNSDKDHYGKIPTIAALVSIIIIIVVYNVFKYMGIHSDEAAPVETVELSSASVVVSEHQTYSDDELVEKQNICVLFKGKHITNDEAVDAALGNLKEATAKNYRIHVIRPCKKPNPTPNPPIRLSYAI